MIEHTINAIKKLDLDSECFNELRIARINFLSHDWRIIPIGYDSSFSLFKIECNTCKSKDLIPQLIGKYDLLNYLASNSSKYSKSWWAGTSCKEEIMKRACL